MSKRNLCTAQIGEDKLYWYALSYSGQETATNQYATAVTYSGFPDSLLTVKRINDAKKSAGVTNCAVLMGATYMGHATKAEILGD